MHEITHGYAPVNGLSMYYEIHGSGTPLVLLHGGAVSIETTFMALLPTLAQTRKVIAIEQQGHGHTADIDRPLTFEQMADDIAALLRHLKIDKADFFGYSDGGNVAIGVVIRHPNLVRKFAVASTHFNNDGLQPGVVESFEQITPEMLGDQLREAYETIAPRPEDWPTLVAKVMQQAITFPGWHAEDLRAIKAPAMVIIGDNDIVRPEHAVELSRLLPHSRLAIFPDADHVAIIVTRADWLFPMLTEFLDAPPPTAEKSPMAGKHDE